VDDEEEEEDVDEEEEDEEDYDDGVYILESLLPEKSPFLILKVKSIVF